MPSLADGLHESKRPEEEKQGRTRLQDEMMQSGQVEHWLNPEYPNFDFKLNKSVSSFYLLCAWWWIIFKSQSRFYVNRTRTIIVTIKDSGITSQYPCHDAYFLELTEMSKCPRVTKHFSICLQIFFKSRKTFRILGRIALCILRCCRNKIPISLSTFVSPTLQRNKNLNRFVKRKLFSRHHRRIKD